MGSGSATEPPFQWPASVLALQGIKNTGNTGDLVARRSRLCPNCRGNLRLRHRTLLPKFDGSYRTAFLARNQ